MSFSPGLFGFLLELKANNNREWFNANKDRYEALVKEPLLQFITDFGPRLRELSLAFVADPRANGGSLFRIYRDTRFSKDKTPYKTHAAAQFRHVRGKDVHAPGYYLHLEPGEVFVGAGMWRPDTASQKAIRERIDAKPDAWRAAVAGLTLGGESLVRPPKGFDKDHPLIADLKRKDYIASVRFTEDEACAPDFLDRFTASCRSLSPLVGFLSRSVGLES